MDALAEKTRLFVESGLTEGAAVELDRAQAHYLRDVMRLGAGATLALFNGRDGEWRGRVDAVARDRCAVRLEVRLRPQQSGPDLWLVFAPIKRARIDFVAAKATELGVSALWPVITAHTAVERINVGRLRANAIEAAEQCGRLDVPRIVEPAPLAKALAGWPAGRRLAWCGAAGQPIAAALAGVRPPPRNTPDGGWAVLVGPEGGFARSELDALGKLPFAAEVRLGPRVLRADTAALAALACWQAVLGDWR